MSATSQLPGTAVTVYRVLAALTPTARPPWPSPGSSTPRSPPSRRPAGAPSPITCTTASYQARWRGRLQTRSEPCAI